MVVQSVSRTHTCLLRAQTCRVTANRKGLGHRGSLPINRAQPYRISRPVRPVTAVAEPSQESKTSSSAKPSASAKPAPDTQKVVELLKAAAKRPGSVPKAAVFAALRDLEAAKLPEDDWVHKLGGTKSPGRRWKLVYTVGSDALTAANKGESKGSGYYFPLQAVQRWDAEASEIENGVYFGWLGALLFSGPFSMKGKKLDFTFEDLSLRLGPKTFKFGLPTSVGGEKQKGKSPFFLFAYVDDNICVARGRGGGLAFWVRTTPTWEVSRGIIAK
ncbi:hypothetical protein WJX72_006526 [[Myrmecia] bisecta]|uniref:Plastid lipid-associated protein/fibrillin conserved domain-containing protein n=1 Tax=[Myrmecia] bisecta TaxID=41462 RepID=A0AAW1PP65_9CHLO